MLELRLKNGNFNKNALSKIESQCHVDFKDVFGSKIVQVLSGPGTPLLPAAVADGGGAARDPEEEG
jgi:hypothetical protein